MVTHLTVNDYERSRTSFAMAEVAREIGAIEFRRDAMLLDVGCGYGGIAATLRDALDLRSAHGVDIDARVIDEARAKGVQARVHDVASAPLPYPNASFDLLTCFGMLDYLSWYDVAAQEFWRVLKPDGLMGYQPRDVEFCSIRAVGLAPLHRSSEPVGHVHTPTTRAFREFMDLMGFHALRIVGVRPRNNPPIVLIRTVDAVIGRLPSLARRFLYIGRRASDPPGSSEARLWAPPA